LWIAGVGHAQPPAASPAGHDAGEERPATATGLDPSGTTVIVEGELLLIALELVPADVAFVMILDHHFPRPIRLSMPVASPCPPVDDGGTLLALSVDVDACVKWIVQNRNDVAIANRHPFEVRHPTFIGRPREVDLIDPHRKQHLPRTAEFAEAREDESDHFLEAQVRVKAKSEFAMPDIAERD